MEPETIFNIVVIVFSAFGLAYVGFISWQSYRSLKKIDRQHEQREQNRLQRERDRTLYRLIRHNQGRVSLLEFAVETNLPAQEAREHLETAAIEYGGVAEFTERGGTVYTFDL